MDVCKEVTHEEDDDDRGKCCEKDRECCGEKIGEEDAKADDDSRENEENNGIEEDPERDHKEEQKEEEDMADMADDEFKTSTNCRKNAALANYNVLFGKDCEDAEDVRKKPKNDDEYDHGDMEARWHVTQNKRANGDDDCDVSKDKEFSYGKEWKKVEERKDKATLHFFLLMGFGCKADDCAETHLRNENFEDDKQNEDDEKCNESPQGQFPH